MKIETTVTRQTVEVAGSGAEIQVTKNVQTVETLTGVLNVTQIGGHLRRLFVAGDYAGGSLLLGTIEAGKVIQQTVVEISETLDAGYITVGTQDAQGILIATGEAANVQGMYVCDNHYAPDATTQYKIFFHGSPTAGEGSVTVYYL